MIRIIDFITILRESDMYIEDIYTQGGCYQFYLILTKIYHDTDCYINATKDHIITGYKDVCYDIIGVITNKKGYTLITDLERKKAEKWSFHSRCMLQLTECENCDEPIIYNP